MLNCVSFCKGSTAPSRLRPAQVARFPWTRRQPPALCGGFPKRSRPHTHVWRREKGSGTSSLAHTTPHHTTPPPPRPPPLCSQPAAWAGAAQSDWRVPGSPLAETVRLPGSEPRAPPLQGQARRHRCRDRGASLYEPQARRRKSERRSESGIRRGGRTFDARPS